jgi:DNA-binding SARP family transcriptional activator
MGRPHSEPVREPGVPFELRLLGGFELRDGRGGAVALSTRKTEALLALLALQPGEPIARDKLCGLLWPDVPDTQARHSLRQTLSQLRKALRDEDGSALRADTRTLTLDTSQLRVDVASLREHLETASREALALAAQLYRGELLDGLFLNELPFEQWLTIAREQLREAMVAGFKRLVDAHEKAGEDADALQASVRLLQLDPWRESAHRSLMQLHVRQGRRAAAVAHYQSFARKLLLELGSEPETATQQLYAELQASPGAQRSQRRADPSLFSIGRDGELALLKQREQQAGLTLLLGEAGVGKTHVCELLAASLASTGRRVLRGRCFESEQVLPFALWGVPRRARTCFRCESAFAGVGSTRPHPRDLGASGALSRVSRALQRDRCAAVRVRGGARAARQ